MIGNLRDLNALKSRINWLVRFILPHNSYTAQTATGGECRLVTP